MKHAIADIRFTEAASSLVCECGADFHTPTPEALNEPYQAHRVEEGQRRKTYNTSELAPPGDPIRWRDGMSLDPQRAYRLRNPDKVKEQQRRYNEKRRGKVAA